MKLFNKIFSKFNRKPKHIEIIKKLLVSMGESIIEDDFIEITNYPFEPSIAYRQTHFSAKEIRNIDYKSYPPTIQIDNELIFLSAEKRTELEIFAQNNDMKLIERQDIWGWILEPFLDTEFADDENTHLMKLLNEYGLTENMVSEIRNKVGPQMIKYNFDTMLWEWVNLGASDVLRAMRLKLDKSDFRDFYKQVMEIALLDKKE